MISLTRPCWELGSLPPHFPRLTRPMNSKPIKSQLHSWICFRFTPNITIGVFKLTSIFMKGHWPQSSGLCFSLNVPSLPRIFLWRPTNFDIQGHYHIRSRTLFGRNFEFFSRDFFSSFKIPYIFHVFPRFLTRLLVENLRSSKYCTGKKAEDG